MEQTVYVDLFFMINFSMDFLCFYLTSRLLGIKMKPYRAVIASALGGIYANLALLWGLSGVAAIALDAAACALMCFVAFGFPRRFGGAALYILVYIAVSMTLGGFMTALFNLLNRMGLGGAEVGGDGISAWLLLALAAVSAVITLMGGRFFRRKTSKKSVTLKISLRGKSVTLRALCDSGNMLRDPISGKLCVVVSSKALRNIIPNDIIRAAKSFGSGLSDSAAASLGVRLIPTRTATGDGLMVAVKADKITVEDGKNEYDIDALLALSELESFSDGAGALLPTELLS